MQYDLDTTIYYVDNNNKIVSETYRYFLDNNYSDKNRILSDTVYYDTDNPSVWYSHEQNAPAGVKLERIDFTYVKGDGTHPRYKDLAEDAIFQRVNLGKSDTEIEAEVRNEYYRYCEVDWEQNDYDPEYLFETFQECFLHRINSILDYNDVSDDDECRQDALKEINKFVTSNIKG